MSDILFNRDDYVFSYRVARILVRDNKILLQKPTNDTGTLYLAAMSNLAKPTPKLWNMSLRKKSVLTLWSAR